MAEDQRVTRLREKLNAACAELNEKVGAAMGPTGPTGPMGSTGPTGPKGPVGEETVSRAWLNLHSPSNYDPYDNMKLCSPSFTGGKAAVTGLSVSGSIASVNATGVNTVLCVGMIVVALGDFLTVGVMTVASNASVMSFLHSFVLGGYLADRIAAKKNTAVLKGGTHSVEGTDSLSRTSSSALSVGDL